MENAKTYLKCNTRKFDLDFEQSTYKLNTYNKAQCIQLEEKHDKVVELTFAQKENFKNRNAVLKVC